MKHSYLSETCEHIWGYTLTFANSIENTSYIIMESNFVGTVNPCLTLKRNIYEK